MSIVSLRQIRSDHRLGKGGKARKEGDLKKLMIDPAWCKGCGICAAFCPKQALELAGEKIRLKSAELCVLCGMCELRCPDYAIWISEEDDE